MPRNVTDDKSTLVQVKPLLPEPMLTQFHAAIWRNKNVCQRFQIIYVFRSSFDLTWSVYADT